VRAVPGALIIGGGIAGLASALALTRLGWRCTILEPKARPHRSGKGLLLPPCGHIALKRLGVRHVPTASSAIHTFQLCGRDGSLLHSFPIPGSLSLLHRDLRTLLLKALPDGTELIDQCCKGLEAGVQGEQRILMSDGELCTADLIVAADGVGSVCRRALFPDAVLTAEQVTELVLVTPAPALVEQLAGCCRKLQDPEAGLALGLMPCRNGQLLLYAQLATARHAIPAAGSAADFLRQRFQGWMPELDALLAELSSETTHIWHTTDLDPLPRLHHDNVVLVGDSGHPLLPFTSQGVATALEDALQLAAALEGVEPGDNSAVRAGLARFSASRMPALARMLREGRDMRRQFLEPAPGAPSCRAPLVGFGLECSGSR
jgi:2-polyprenyl-6-methoxyphenol hydroxylase-like FAD-dependent oxidoreductase